MTADGGTAHGAASAGAARLADIELEHAMNEFSTSSGGAIVAGDRHRALFDLIEGYASLSRDYANAQEPRLALLAMWMADVHLVHLLLLENGLDDSADPSAQLAGVGEAVNGSLAAMALDGVTPRQFHQQAREAIVATFEEAAHAELLDRFLPMDHLDALPGVALDSADRAVTQRLDGMTHRELVVALEATAYDCVAVARAMLGRGDLEGALHQMHHADVATFEAVLLRTALELGDKTLASVDLGWDLAARAFAERPTPAADSFDLATTVRAWREQLVLFGGWTHVARLQAAFLPVPIG